MDNLEEIMKQESLYQQWHLLDIQYVADKKHEVFQGVERECGGKNKGIEGTAVGIVGTEGMLGRGGGPLANVGIAVGIVGTEGMLGRGGSPLGNVVGSGGSAPGHGNDGRDGVRRLGEDGKLCVCG
ncbi:hypothetical protein Godav_000021 [Gossypium davidsonii]|uniref:Uncharacterized protein n=1 Tax=Gossypium davidsonii TaxID=34287 RepID=A0A7J8TJW0_GOSDV|nr:hypothetical protein [Gossypium davidsonii]